LRRLSWKSTGEFTQLRLNPGTALGGGLFPGAGLAAGAAFSGRLKSLIMV